MQHMFVYPSLHGIDGDMLDAGPVAELAVLAERAGWKGFAFTEHPAPSAKWLVNGGHQSLDPFVALAYIGAVTTELKLLTYISVMPYRNPLLLAKTAATVDKLTGGRMLLGLGTGYLKAEYFALGVNFEERNELFDEALDVLPLHWSGEPFDYEGKHFSARGVMARPTPVQQPIPIWLGGNSMLTLRRVAARAQGWMPMLSSEQTASTARSPHLGSLADVSARLDILRDLAGERFGEISITLSYNDPTIQDLSRDVERHRAALEEYRELGVDWVIVGGPDGPAPRSAEFIEGFADQYIR